jgi:hypothetical protein
MKPTSSFLVSMRSNLLALFAGCVVAVFVTAQSFTPTDVAWMGQLGVESTGSAYLVEEDMEGSGTPDGWVNGGTPNWDYTTAPAPLVGSQSWLGTAVSDASYTSFSAQSDCWAFCYVNVTNLANSPQLLELRNSSGTVLAAARLMSTGAVRAYNGTINGSSAAGVVTTNVTYCVWMRYIKGGGADGKTYVYVVDGSETRPAVTAQVVNGNATNDAARVYIAVSASTTATIIDKLRVSASEIGNDPP